ncbi:ABC transporter substrate-binding protein [Christensenellaceae bacterium OttesenSCG-928-K19]|nr:ABC transporter substrate-binding protein [Christensenellaceae bacterium OttesenSCG-928-K19]
MKRVLIIVMCVVLASAAFLGCAQVEQPAQEEQQTPEPAPTPTPTPTPEPTREFRDAAGRTVQLPMEVESVMGVDEAATSLVYTLCAEKLCGWNEELTDIMKEQIPEEYRGLPVYGLYDGFEVGENTLPDVVVCVGETNMDSERADALQERLEVPVIILTGGLQELPQAYAMLAEASGDEERGKELSAAVERLLGVVQDMEIPGEEERPSVYAAKEADSLAVAAAGGGRELVELAGGVNAVESAVDDKNKILGMSLSELIELNPDVIFSSGQPGEGIDGQDAAWKILDNPAYGTMDAVIGGRVYGVPSSPFPWLEAPESPNRAIGLVWMAALLYPELYEGVNLGQEIKDFYALFYGRELSDSALEELVYVPTPEEETEEE